MQVKTKRIRVAKILSDAADYHLKSHEKSDGGTMFSCTAVLHAAEGTELEGLQSNLYKVLQNLGLPGNCPGDCFNEYYGNCTERNQNERYLWLKFAAEYCRLHDVRVTIKSFA